MKRRHLTGAAFVIVGIVASGALPARAAGSRDGGNVAARPVALAGSWGRAIEIPGLSALNTGHGVNISSLSCGSSGNCAVGGSYRTRSGHRQAFVASEQNGQWRTAIEVPGTATLNAGGYAEVLSLSCASSGSCAAGGVYTDGSKDQQAFVASESSGAWGTAIEVPGSAALNADGQAQVSSVSCPSAGSCVAGGTYTDSGTYSQAFVVSERNGTWGTAIRIPFNGNAYYPDGYGAINAVSCASAGNCAAGGYDNGDPIIPTDSAFVVNEKNGRWGKVRQVPGLATLSVGRPDILSVSCASAGNCVAGGYYLDHSGHGVAFVANEKNGTWGRRVDVARSAAGETLVSSVMCASAGNCAAGGSMTRRRDVLGFVASEKNGVWGKAIAEPGSGTLSGGRNAIVGSVSCASARNCVAGGGSKDSSFHWQAFVISERGGSWGKALKVPGSAALNAGGLAAVDAVSCARRGRCAAAGTYRDRTGATEGFVVSQNRA
jgi:hypothetical protein